MGACSSSFIKQQAQRRLEQSLGKGHFGNYSALKVIFWDILWSCSLPGKRVRFSKCTSLCTLTTAYRTARCSVVPSSPVLSAIKLSQLYSVKNVWVSSLYAIVIKFSYFSCNFMRLSPHFYKFFVCMRGGHLSTQLCNCLGTVKSS